MNVIENFEPTFLDSNIIEYELVDDRSNKLKIFFNKNSLNLMGWKTIDTYSNEVKFIIKNIKSNVPVKNDIFKIPKEEDL